MVRIRKNLKFSPLLFCSQASAHDDLQPRVCKLNLSPWDVIVPSLLDSSHQFEAEEDLYVNTSLSHSIGVEESVASPMEIEYKPKPATGEVHGSVSTDGNGFRRCQRTNGKSWQCKKEANEGGSLCDHHQKLHSRRNVNYCNYTDKNNVSNSNTTSNGTAYSFPWKKAIVPEKELGGSTHRVRPKVVATKEAATLKNLYRSGFGPRWGRDRGISKHKMEAKVAAAENVGTTPTVSCTTTQFSNPESPPSHKIEIGDQLDYIEDDFDDDEEEDEGGECGRKRVRRQVKARSLKSLM
ncbi:uncharacterized protein LOC126803152 [Argentina anserina]|uniref:uncharacterized protein LOC126803152 n=1 Tax=Argentina anserina TaxID=57926 RepID=UPI00217685EF|nr:uncharacterized protein LOC126803152 [Potentilla anserina]